MPARFIAIDLGAESGRVIVATLAGGRLGLEVVHRFPNGPIAVAEADGESLRWDLPAVGFTRRPEHFRRSASPSTTSLMRLEPAWMPRFDCSNQVAEWPSSAFSRWKTAR